MERSGTEKASFFLSGDGPPDLASLDTVARAALETRRQGGRLVILGASPSLTELLELAGSPVEVAWEVEEGEEALGLEEVKEVAEPGDLAL